MRCFSFILYTSLAPAGTVRALYSGFTNGVGRIWLDNVNCAGTENRLTDCPARPWGDHNCNHGEDAGVTCTGKKPASIYFQEKCREIYIVVKTVYIYIYLQSYFF